MPEMTIRFEKDMEMMAVEVVSPDLTIQQTLPMWANRQVRVEVPSKGCFVRLLMPYGPYIPVSPNEEMNYVVSRDTNAEQAPKTKKVRSARVRGQTKRAQLEGINRAAWATPKHGVCSQADAQKATDSSVVTSDLEREVVIGNNVGVRWYPSVEGSKRVSSDNKTVFYRLKNGAEPRFLEVMDKYLYRIAVPGSAVTVCISSNLLQDDHQHVSIEVSTTSVTADTVSIYLLRNDFDAAKAMAGWARSNLRQVREGKRDSYVTAVAAYLIYHLGRAGEVHGWTGLITDNATALPDGLYLLAAISLFHDKNPEQAMYYIDQGLHRGLPVYTEGLRLLIDVLHRCGDYGRIQLEKINRDSLDVVWGSPFTTTIHEIIEDRQQLSDSKSLTRPLLSLSVGYG